MSIQEKGELPDQRKAEVEDIRGPGQVENDEGGFVYKADDMTCFLRFVTLGCTSGPYYANDRMRMWKNLKCIDNLVRAGQGKEALKKIKEISLARRNLRQDSLLYALALLARSSCEQTKEAVYLSLPELCRTPSHLFMFVNFCEEASSRGGTERTGWGRAHKKAICRWYSSFKQNPMKLARLVTKYQKRYDCTHLDVMRRAHPKCDGSSVAFILKYIAKGYIEAQKAFRDQQQTDAVLRQVSAFLRCCNQAKNCKNPDEMSSLIRENKLSWEHCATSMLNERKVWAALLLHINVEALIRNLAKMTEIGLFPEGSLEEELAIKKICSINSEGEVSEEEAELEGEEDHELSWQQAGRRVHILHPYQVLIGWMNYKNGYGEKSTKRWVPNSHIVKALEKAFYKAFEGLEPTGKKFFLAIHMTGAMSQPAIGPSHRANPLDYTNAAATMMMVTRRTEENVIIKGFSDKVVDLFIERDDTLEQVVKKSFPMAYGGIDCSQPMKYAIENKIDDVDVFVIYTDSQTVNGNIHASEALHQYREYRRNRDVKLIVCAMVANEFTIADPDDQNMLDIVGFDAAAPRLIAEFARGQ